MQCAVVLGKSHFRYPGGHLPDSEKNVAI